MKAKIQDIYTHALEWAQEAGKIQLSYFRNKQLDMTTKSNISDVVTEADKACENFLIHSIYNRYPDHNIIGEESGEHPNSGDFCWIIDPLDGTNNFSQGIPFFCVSVGIQYKGETVIGIVYAPYLNELYTSIKGEGAYMNGSPIQVSAKKQLEESILATGFPYDKNENPDNNINNLTRILPRLRGIRRTGSAALDLCYVAAGWLDGYWELNLHIWDVCAGILLVEEAGGTVSDFRKDRGIAIVAGNKEIVTLIKKNLMPV